MALCLLRQLVLGPIGNEVLQSVLMMKHRRSAYAENDNQDIPQELLPLKGSEGTRHCRRAEVQASP
jgi:hypothetical protein